MRLAAEFVMNYGSGSTAAERMKTSFKYLAEKIPYKRTYDHPTSKAQLPGLAIDMFKNKIPVAIIDDMDIFLIDNKYELRNEVGVISDYYKSTNQDYIVNCKINEEKMPFGGTLWNFYMTD